MSILTQITYWLDPRHQELFQIIPTLGGDPVRKLYGTSEIQGVIEGPWGDEEHEIRCGKLWEDFDRYVEGRPISVSLDNPYKKPTDTYLARLDPGRDEVWEIRSRTPKPGIRVFGRFAETDTLILTNWEYREPLGGPGSEEFKIEIRKCQAEWKRLFPTHNSHTGSSVNEYISKNAFSV
jgi:hypothetical protein